MAPRKSCENTEGTAAKAKNTHMLLETENIINHDPLLACAADSQQLGVSSLIYTYINDVYHPL